MFESTIAQLMALLVGELISLVSEKGARVLLNNIKTDLSKVPFVFFLSQIATMILAFGDLPTAVAIWGLATVVGALCILAEAEW